MSDMAQATDSDELAFMSATDMIAQMRSGSLSPVEIVAAVLDRIERIEPLVNAMVTIRRTEALAEAQKAAEALRGAPERDGMPLLGLPVLVKDLEDTKGVRTTFGSKLFRDRIPDQDAPIWARLKAAGAILIGKTTTPEFGLHTVTESLLTGITNNPWDITRTTGGSSGGSAAAIAAGYGPLSTGSDGGGSIRVPSSLCGVVGLKASPGRIPMNSRLSAYESVSVVGPMTRTVADNALMLNVVAGPDPYDAISLPASDEDYAQAIRHASVRGLRVAYSPDLGSGPVDPEVAEVVRAAAQRFEVDLGANVEEVSLVLPDPIEYFTAWWGPQITVTYLDELLAAGDVADVHPVIVEFVDRVKSIGLYEYVRTQSQVRSRIHAAFADVFSKFDLLIWPTTSTVAYPHPGPIGGPLVVGGQPVRDSVLENQRLTEAISHGGYPAISIPAGFTRQGLPVGLQIAAGHFRDSAVLRAAAAYEAAAPWAHMRPSLAPLHTST